MSGDPLLVERDALGLIELASIARGVVVLDQMAKRAETTIVAARTLSPGRYLIIISGAVAEVEEAMDAGLIAASDERVGDLIIHDPHPGLRAALASRLEVPLDESMAIVETRTIASVMLAVDRVLKETDVALLELRLGAGLSGKGVFTITGPLHMIEAAREVAEAAAADACLHIEVIAQPHPDLPQHLLGAERPTVRGPQGS